jgi:hypothetical protein
MAMWFYPIVGLLVVLAILGGVLLGGVFTIVLVPLALIAAGAAIAYSLAARASEPSASGGTDDRPLPSGQQAGGGHVRTTPETLADARRAQQ